MISFSGIDCSGKSTQIELLRQALESQGKRCKVIWSRGGYTPMLSAVKRLIKRNRNASKEETIAYSNQVHQNPRKRKLLLIASLIDLWIYYSAVLRLYELFGKTVICDRYIWDTYIDFRIKYPDCDFEQYFLWKLILRTMKKPDASFVLVIPAELSMYRSSLKEEPFPEAVEDRRKRIALYMQEMDNNRWQYVINAEKTITEVFEEIRRNLNGFVTI